MPTRRSGRQRTASPPRPRSTRATTSATAARSTSAPSRAIPRRGREARGLSGRLPDGLRPGHRQDEGLSDPRAAPGDHQHHARRDRRRRLHLHLLGPPARSEENAHFLVLDLADGQLPRPDGHAAHLCLHRASITSGRAYHPMLGGDIAALRSRRPTNSSGSSRRSTAQPPAAESHLADPEGHPINWDISPDRKTLYAVPMSANQLYAYDLTADRRRLCPAAAWAN